MVDSDPSQQVKVDHKRVALLVAAHALLAGADTLGRLFGLSNPPEIQAAFRRRESADNAKTGH